MRLDLLTYALKNVTRRPLRSGALSLGVAATAGTLFLLAVFYVSITASVKRAAERLGADAVVVASGWKAPEGGLLLSGGPTAAYLDPDTVSRISKFEGVAEATGQLFIVSASLACCSIANTVLVGYEPETDFTVSPWLRDSLDRMPESDEIVVGPDILSEPGGRIRFFNKVFRVVAKLEPTGIKMMDSAVFIPMEGAREMIAGSEDVPINVSPEEVSAVLLRFDKGVDHAGTALKMELSIPGVSVVMASDAMNAARRDMLGPLRLMSMIAVLWWFVSIVISGVLYGIMLEARKSEIELLRSLGAKRSHLMGMILLEVLMISFAGALAGVALGWIALRGLSLAGDLLLVPDVSVLLLYGLVALLAGILTAIISTLYPLMRYSSRRDP